VSGQKITWNYLVDEAGSGGLLGAAMRRVADGLSGMVGQIISNDAPRVKTVPIAQAAMCAGDPEAEVAIVYLLMEGDLRGQTILILSLDSALNLINLLMDAPPGTPTITSNLDLMQRSSLAEVGNLAISYFLNAVAVLTGTQLRPSPPAVVVGMLGAILSMVVTPVAAVSDDLLIIETSFRDAAGTVYARLWVLPDPISLRWPQVPGGEGGGAN
jgi:chemotaxis protein CheC